MFYIRTSSKPHLTYNGAWFGARVLPELFATADKARAAWWKLIKRKGVEIVDAPTGQVVNRY